MVQDSGINYSELETPIQYQQQNRAYGSTYACSDIREYFDLLFDIVGAGDISYCINLPPAGVETSRRDR